MDAAPLDRPERMFLAALLAGGWTERGLADAAATACGRRLRFVRPFARRLLAAFPEPPAFDRLAAFALADAGYLRWRERARACVRFLDCAVPRMAPHPAAEGWDVPPLRTARELADLLGVSLGELEWFADRRRRGRADRAEPLRHYRYAWRGKRDGGARLIEAPKPRLKAIQRAILRSILARVPPHPAAHGFVPGRSIVTNAAPHCGRAVVLRFDVRGFFPAVGRPQVYAIFATAGYPPPVAGLLASLCTTRLPADVWDAGPTPEDFAARQRLLDYHLPQGAPTSPALANLAAYRLDCRLAALADAVGGTYTRYADDLTVSGGEDVRAAAGRIRRAVGRVAAEEGFGLNAGKTRVMGRGGRQRVAGVVVNVRPNVARAEFDRLKAVLTNCVRHGPAGQNRDGRPDFRAYLAGKFGHLAAVNPARGRKLWAVFDRIAWPA